MLKQTQCASRTDPFLMVIEALSLAWLTIESVAWCVAWEAHGWQRGQAKHVRSQSCHHAKEHRIGHVERKRTRGRGRHICHVKHAGHRRKCRHGISGLKSWGSSPKILSSPERRLLDGLLSRSFLVVVRVLSFACFARVARDLLALPRRLRQLLFACGQRVHRRRACRSVRQSMARSGRSYNRRAFGRVDWRLVRTRAVLEFGRAFRRWNLGCLRRLLGRRLRLASFCSRAKDIALGLERLYEIFHEGLGVWTALASLPRYGALHPVCDTHYLEESRQEIPSNCA